MKYHDIHKILKHYKKLCNCKFTNPSRSTVSLNNTLCNVDNSIIRTLVHRPQKSPKFHDSEYPDN